MSGVVTSPSREQLQADCLAIADSLGSKMARVIMERVVIHDLDPDEMQELISTAIGSFKATIIEAGGNPHDVEIASQHVYRALVKEGGHLARTMTWEAGQA